MHEVQRSVGVEVLKIMCELNAQNLMDGVSALTRLMNEGFHERRHFLFGRVSECRKPDQIHPRNALLLILLCKMNTLLKIRKKNKDQA